MDRTKQSQSPIQANNFEVKNLNSQYVSNSIKKQ